MKYMATIYFRKTNKSGMGGVWWVKGYHPITAIPICKSLGTSNKKEAERILHRLKLEIEYRRPNLAPLPPYLLKELGPIPSHCLPAVISPHEQPVTSPSANSTTVVAALRSYYAHIIADNDRHHVAGKLSILRAFFGSSAVEEATGESCRKITPAYYKTNTLEDFTPLFLQEFMASREISNTTRKYYREVFHHFIEKMMDLSLYVPPNPTRPNPAASLPSYQSKNAVIIYLSENEISIQLAALSSEPIIQLAVEIMIYAGLRREEVAGLRSQDILDDCKIIEVAKYIDPRTQHRSTAGRTMISYGFPGMKSRKSQGAIRRFPLKDIEIIEKLMKSMGGVENEA